MQQHLTLEIFGTVDAPFLPEAIDGLPRITIALKARSAGTERFVSYCSCQVSGSPMPFSLRLNPEVLGSDDELTLEASCGTAPGKDWKVAETAMPLALNEQTRIGPLELQLTPLPGQPTGMAEKTPIPPTVVPLTLSVQIPEAQVMADTHLDVTLLRVQEDGHSNLASSNIAGTSLSQAGSSTPVTLYLDANVLAETDRLKLHVAQYNLERTVALAGYVIRDLGPNDLRDFGEITLRTKRN